MTRLPSPSFRSSSEISSPLDLDSALTARLQVALSQTPVTDYAVLPNYEALGAGVPSLLPYLAEEGLVLFTKRLSFGVVGSSHDTGQLLHKPGKSKNGEQI